MARPGDVITNPVTGERIEFRETATSTDGARVTFDYYLRPGGFALGKVQHVHPRQAERIDLESGRLTVRIDDDEWTATPGTSFTVPPGTKHTVRNDGSDPVHALVTVEPALALERFFETAFALAADGEATRLGLPGPLGAAILADAFSDEIAVGGVPVPVQRLLASTVARVGRAAGYRLTDLDSRRVDPLDA